MHAPAAYGAKIRDEVGAALANSPAVTPGLVTVCGQCPEVRKLAWIALSSLMTGLVWGRPMEKLRPGDHLEIRVFALPECEQRYRIGRDGKLRHPLAGEFQAAGRSLDEVRAVLKARLQHNLRNPKFSLHYFRPALSAVEVSVLGEVRKQGLFQPRPHTRWSELIDLAGGLTEKADLREAVVFREEKQLPLTESSESIDGDVLYIPPGLQITIFGEVAKPGIYCLSRTASISLEQILATAGGVIDSDSISRVEITRPHQREPLEVKLGEPLSLQDGDVVRVVPRGCLVTGLVKMPGFYPLKREDTLSSILAKCGTGSARLNRVTVERAHSTGPQEVYDLEVDPASPPQIRIFDGDIIWVPDSSAPSRQAALMERLNIPGALDLYRVWAI